MLMKNFLLILLYFINNVLVLSAQGTPGKWGDQGNGTYINPILNADYSDPDVIRVRDKYYMIASDFHFLGMQVLESSDMINWKLISQIYHHFDFPGWDNNQQYAGGSWAPSIRYHDNKFWVFFCTPKEGLFMSNAVNPSGPWSPLHLVKKVEKWEDPCPFWDEDGQAYLGRSRHGAGPIIIHKMSADGTRLLDEGMTVYTGPVAEGTKIFKKDGYYYLSIPEGGVGTGWQTILRSKNIYGPYEKKVVLEQGSTTINGPHQGAIVDTPDGQWAFFHFQHHHALGRVVHLQPMHWENDWPVIGVDFDRNGIGEPVYVCQKPIESKTIFAPQTDDDFSTPNLSLQWQFNHNPTDHAWSLSAHPGSLTLKALKSSTFRLARNTLTQKIMGNISEATIAMDFTEIADGQRCGLACMGKENKVLGIKMEKGQKYLYISNDTTEISTTFLNGNQIYLRVSIDMLNQKFQYFYSTDNIRFIPYGTSFFIPFGFWKGARIALYCYNKEQEAGATSFQWFKYKHDGPQNKIENTAEQIIANIARTSFPHKKIKVIDRATLRPEAIAFTTRLAPLTASPQANRLLLAVYPALSTAMLSRLSVANRSSLINPSCSGCRKPMARKTRSASMISFLPVCLICGRPPSGEGAHSTSSTSTPIRLFFSPIKRLEARFHRRIQPSSWLLLVFSTWGYMGQGVAGFCPTGGWGMISIWVTQAAP